MGNRQSSIKVVKKSKKDKSSNGKAPKNVLSKDVDGSDEEEACPFMDIQIVRQLPNGSELEPERMRVAPFMELSKLKEDLCHRFNLPAVSVYRNQRNDELAPDHMTLSALQIEGDDCLTVRAS